MLPAAAPFLPLVNLALVGAILATVAPWANALIQPSWRELRWSTRAR